MPLAVTEDTPPDMLAGAMDIKVVLPGGRSVNMSVDRSTPMMDLLVQLTTTHKLSLAGHMTVALSESGARLHHLPSTPVGALDTRLLHVAPRNNTTLKRAPLRPNNAQPFQTTFRLQVHLPRNQLFVTRVSPDTCLADILRQACAEKNLDPSKYELRHPANLQEKLSLSHTLGDYHLQEVTMVAARPMGSPLTPADIMALQKEEEKRRQQVKASGSAYGIVFNKRSSTNVHQTTGSVSSDSLNGRSISPARSDESANRSISPPAPLPPQRPGRKRRPAPKPPAPVARIETSGKDESMTNHSRTSSDSSGYHEASVVSESTETRTAGDISADTLPRRSKLPPSNTMAAKEKATTLQNGSSSNNNHVNLSRSLSNLTSQVGISGLHSVSTTSLSSQGQFPRKKKAAPPPPVAPARKQAQPPPTVVNAINSSQAAVQVPTAQSTNNTAMTTIVEVKPVPGDVVVTVVEKRRPETVKEEVKMDERRDSSNIVVVKTVVKESELNQEVSKPAQDVAKPVQEVAKPAQELAKPAQEVAKPVQEVSKPAQEVSKPVQETPKPVQVSPILKNQQKDKVVPTATERKPATTPVPVANASITQAPTFQRTDLTKPVPQPRPRLLAKPSPSPRMTVAPTIAPRNKEKDQVTVSIVPEEQTHPTKEVIQEENEEINSDFEYISPGSSQASRKSSGYGSVGQAFGRGKTLLALSTVESDSVLSDTESVKPIRNSEEFDIKDSELELFELSAESHCQEEVFHLGRNRFSDLDFEISHNSNSKCEAPVDKKPKMPIAKSNSEVVMSNVSSETSLMSLDEIATLRMGESNLSRWSNVESLAQKPAWRLGSQDTESDVVSEHDFDRERCNSSELESSEWEYQLPDPPSAFRDLESPTLTEFGTVALADTPVFHEPRVEQRKLSIERTTVGPKTSRANDFDDSWEPQTLGNQETKARPPHFVNGDLRLREDGVTKEVFKVNPIFNAQQYEEESSTRKIPAKYAPAASEIIEKSKSLTSHSVSNDLQSSNQLRNFTISAYEKPQNVDVGQNAGEEFKKPLSPKPVKPPPLMRTNSYTSNDVPRPPPTSVKRSTSYIALARPYSRPSSFQSINRTKSISSLVEEDSSNGELRKATSEVNVSRVAVEEEPMLASLQVLKSILSQSQLALNIESNNQPEEANDLIEATEDVQATNQQAKSISLAPQQMNNVNLKELVQSVAVQESKPTPVDEPDLGIKKSSFTKDPETVLKEAVKEEPEKFEPKPFVYLGPPAINFGSWSERPKVQVSIKSDRDYRFGGKVSNTLSQNNGSSNSANTNTLINRYNSAGNRNSMPANYTIVEAKPAKIEPTPLTMKIVTHTTSSESRDHATSRPAETRQMQPIIRSDPDEVDNSSRLPIVRSVELKKTVPDNFVQLRNKSSTHLNGGINNIAQVSVNNYQDNISNRHSYIESDTGILPSHILNKSMSSSQLNVAAPNKLVNMNRKYTSVVGINGGSVNSLPRPPVTTKPDAIKASVFSAPKPMPIVKGFRMAVGDNSSSIKEELPTNPTPVVDNKPINYTNNKTSVDKPNAFRGQPLKTINGVENVRQQPSWAQRSEKFTTLNSEPASVIKFKKPVQRPLEQKFTNPRDALMDAIKNFGGQDAMKLKNETGNGSS